MTDDRGGIRVQHGSAGRMPGSLDVDCTPEKGDGVGRRDWPRDFPPGSPGTAPRVTIPARVASFLDNHPIDHTVTWHPVLERHIIWRRATSSGSWLPLMVCQNPFDHAWAGIGPKQPIPFDNRLMAWLYDSDPRTYGGAREMAQQARAQADRDEAVKNDRYTEWLREMHGDARRNTQIRVSGRGRSPGDRFARQDGGIVSKEENIVDLY